MCGIAGIIVKQPDTIKIKDHLYLGIEREVNYFHLNSKTSKIVSGTDYDTAGIGFITGYQINDNIAIEASYSNTKSSNNIYCENGFLGCHFLYYPSRQFHSQADAKIVNLDSILTYNFGDRMKFLAIAGLSRAAYKYTIKEIYIAGSSPSFQNLSLESIEKLFNALQNQAFNGTL